MAYNKKTRAYAVKRVLLIISGVICTSILLYAAFVFYRSTAAGGPGKSTVENVKMEENKITVARSREAMKSGTLLDQTMVEMVRIPTELAPAGAISNASKLGNVRLRHDVSKNELLTAEDILPEGTQLNEDDRLMEHNFPEGSVPAAVAEGSFIDIKLIKKGGEDRFVISKTLVVSRNANLLTFYLDKREQELIKEAAAEGLLITVGYLSAEQVPSNVDYIPPYEKRNAK